MRLPVCIALLALALPASGQVDPFQEELRKLEGQWVQVSVEADGQKLEGQTDGPTVTISGKLWIDRSAAGGHASTFTIDPTQNPKHIDKLLRLNKDKTVALPGIYALDDDTLRVCEPFPFGGNFALIRKRASEFATKRGQPFVTTVYKRVRPYNNH